MQAVADAALGSHALHEAGIAHANITPSNILLGTRCAKLADPSLLAVLDPGRTTAGTRAGDSVDLTDPSILLGAAPSRASDVWSLGATLHRMLTGQSLFGVVPDVGETEALRHVIVASGPARSVARAGRSPDHRRLRRRRSRRTPAHRRSACDATALAPAGRLSPMAVPAVRLDDLQLTVVPGEGLVGRFGEVALLALSGGSGAAIDQLLATCRALGRARIDEPGAILVDQLDALLGERMPASPSFCVLATSAEGVEVVLCGEVEVTVARGGQVSRHAGPDPDTWVDLLVDEGFDWLVAVPIGSAEPPSDVRLDLHDGVVPGGGLRLTQRDRLPGEAAATPAPTVETVEPVRRV